MPVDRHPEPPRLSDPLTPLRLDRPLADGDEFSGAEVAGVACDAARVDSVECVDVVLRDPDLSGVVLLDCIFRDTSFANPNLATTTIRGGALTRVVVEGGRLTGLQVAEADLRDVLWTGSGADMATFRHSRLARVTFQDCSLREADFAGMRGEHVRFHDCDLRGATFQHAELAASELRRCRLDGIDGVEGLRGTSMELEHLLSIAPELARALGIDVVDP